MEDFKDQILKWLNGEKIWPTWIQFQPTNFCNLNCLFCARRKQIKDSLTEEKWLDLTKEACRMNVKRITITGGGEPLVKRELFARMIREIKSNKVEGDLVTNGSLIDDHMAKELVSVGWDFISFSVHGSDAKTQDYLSGGIAFDKILEGIKLINEWKRKMGTDKPIMVFHVIISSMNYNQMEDMVRFAKDNDIRDIKLALLMVDDKGELSHLKLRKEQVEVFFENYSKATRLAESFNLTLRTEFTKEEILRYIGADYDKADFREKSEKPVTSKNIIARCLIPFNEMVIFPDGVVSVCCSIHDSYDENSENNFVDSVFNKTLTEVWEGEVFNKIRRMMVDNRPPDLCSHCPPTLIYQRSSDALFLK